MTTCVAITVDVDGEAGLPDGGRGYERRLSSRSERLFGLRRGLPRILDLLADAHATATFFIPGVTAERHAAALEGILDARHEIALHGHTHRRLDAMSEAEQRADLDHGLTALTALTGATPEGYRAPCWELTPDTLRLLGERGFAYDSSLMGDDRPYTVRAGPREIIELPVHWTLDDAPHFAAGGDPESLSRIWCHELALAAAEARALTITVHPEIIGRPHRLAVLRRVLAAASDAGCAIRPLAAIASAHVGEQDGGVHAERACETDHGGQPRVADAAFEP